MATTLASTRAPYVKKASRQRQRAEASSASPQLNVLSKSAHLITGERHGHLQLREGADDVEGVVEALSRGLAGALLSLPSLLALRGFQQIIPCTSWKSIPYVQHGYLQALD